MLPLSLLKACMHDLSKHSGTPQDSIIHMILRCAKTYLKAQCAIRVRDEIAVGRAAALLEVKYGLIRLPAIARAVDFVRLSIAAVASLLLHQPHLQSHMPYHSPYPRLQSESEVCYRRRDNPDPAQSECI